MLLLGEAVVEAPADQEHHYEDDLFKWFPVDTNSVELLNWVLISVVTVVFIVVAALNRAVRGEEGVHYTEHADDSNEWSEDMAEDADVLFNEI